MPDETATQTATGEEVVASPTTETQQAVKSESATDTNQQEGQGEQTNADAANTGTKGAEPAEEPKVKLSELLAIRKRAQEAERRAAYLEGKLDAAQPQIKQAETPKADKEPALEEFDGPTAYEDWIVARTQYQWDNRQKAQREQEQRQSKETAINEKWNERCKSVSEEIPDLDDVLNNPVQPFPTLSNMVAETIRLSESGPQIVYYLHKNPEEGKRLAQMDPRLAIMELAEIRNKAKVALQPKIKKVTQAESPINAGNGNGVTIDTDLSDLPMEEYARKRNEQIFVKVGGRLVRR